MIVYYKLEKILKERQMKWKDLENAGLSMNMPRKFANNQSVTIETVDKVCAYLDVQPGDIMEYIDEKKIEEKKIQNEIDILEAKLKELQKKKENL